MKLFSHSRLLLLIYYALSMADPQDLLRAQETEFIPEAEKSIVFVYDGTTNPCAPPVPGQELLPLGSGFVSGIPKKGTEKATLWTGVKFLITAEHVVRDRSRVILRLNRADRPEFTCHTLILERQGQNQNVFSSERSEVDVVAIYLPAIPNTDPTVFDYSLILNREAMGRLEIQEGTDIFTIGYLWGYSGRSKNYPVKKFGKIALLTDEIWYHSRPPRDMDEQAYLVELQNTPGLSGAPVLLTSPRLRVGVGGSLTYRRNPPYVVGVIKGLLLAPLGPLGSFPQGIAAIEPADHLRGLLHKIADRLNSAGFDLALPDIP